MTGTPHPVRGKDGLILFDLMTHSLAGYGIGSRCFRLCAHYCNIRDTGVGDFGREGILTFLRDHSCNTVCRDLGLDRSMPLEFAESDNPQSSSGEDEEADGENEEGADR